MSPFRRQLRFWSMWTLSAAFLMAVNPFGQLGRIEMLAILGPFLLAIPNRIWREATLVIGLPMLTLVWLADPTESTLLRLIVAWCVYAGGVVLAARVLESQQELESIVGTAALRTAALRTAAHRNQTSPMLDQASEQLRQEIDRELGRARRHDRGFAVLSAASHPHSLESDAAGFLRSQILQSLAESRAQREIEDLLRKELHVYCRVARDDDRVLALVPEIDPDSLEFLLERLRNALDDAFNFEVQVGAACFPRDAVCAEELIEASDRTRKTSKLRSLPEHSSGHSASGHSVPDQGVLGHGVEESSRRTPDVKA